MQILGFTLGRHYFASSPVRLCQRFWQEEDGAILSSELLLVSTLLVVGLVAGLDATRSAILTEMSDVSAAIGTMNQSFSVSGITSPNASTAGSMFVDSVDQGDPTQQFGRFANQSNSCVMICTSAIGEVQ